MDRIRRRVPGIQNPASGALACVPSGTPSGWGHHRRGFGPGVFLTYKELIWLDQ